MSRSEEIYTDEFSDVDDNIDSESNSDWDSGSDIVAKLVPNYNNIFRTIAIFRSLARRIYG